MLHLLPYRGLIWNFVKRDISSKYVGSLLGIYWSVINPLITLIVYIIVFGVFLKVRLPDSSSIWDYSLYFASGFLPWIAFQSSVMRASSSIIENKNYIKKVPFPSEIFPIYTTVSEFVNLLIGLAIYFVLFFILKGTPTIFILLLPLAIFLQVIFTLSLAFFLSSGAVYFRDIPQILGAVFMIWFWVTPIAYTINLIPVDLQWIVKLNPAYYMLEIYRDALFYGKFPEPEILVPFLVFSVVMLILGFLFFRKTKRGFGESMIAIGVYNLGKKFKLYTSPMGRFLEYLTMGRMIRHVDFWALQDISFEIPSGTTLGILGQNGSGKSTLLSILAGVLEPSAGSFRINGKVSAILELGSGFHPEFSGRDNVYMYGSIMGLSREQIDERFDDIIRFSELGDFIDQPLRTYSSGMTVRLAFSVAVNVDADILIVDEALAVGDAIFQHRCFRKIREMQETKKTILYVGHDTEAVRNLCNQAILLDGGKIIEHGDPNTVVSKYNALITEREQNYNEENQVEHGISPANGVTTIFSLISNLNVAEIDTPDPANVNERVIYIRETPRKIIFAHPPSRITYTVTADPESSLSFAIGLLPESFKKITQGVKFDIEIFYDEICENVFSRLLQPQRNIGDKGWHNYVIPLKKYGGKKVSISFSTTGSGRISYCWAAWGWPKIVSEEKNTPILSSDSGNTELGPGTSESLRYGSRKAEIIKVQLLDEHGIPRLSFKSGEKTQLYVEVKLLKPDIAGAVSVAYYIKDNYTTVYGRDTWNYGIRFENQSEGNVIRVKFEQNLILGAGIYSITASVSEVYSRYNFEIMDRMVDCLTIKIESGEKFLTGCVDLNSVVQKYD